jgi:hypothetical protein
VALPGGSQQEATIAPGALTAYRHDPLPQWWHIQHGKHGTTSLKTRY